MPLIEHIEWPGNGGILTEVRKAVWIRVNGPRAGRADAVCGNDRCVNPNHLQVTLVRLTPEQENDIFMQRLDKSLTLGQLAKRYGVSVPTIHNVLKRVRERKLSNDIR